MVITQPIKISIIINTFNVSEYIDRTISSVLSQLTNEIEVIIIDDGSVDDTVSKIKKAISNKDNIRVILQNKNKGISEERNYGIRVARGKYILFIDGDDYIDGNTVFKLLNIVENSNYDLVGFNMEAVPDYVHGNILSNREKKYTASELKEGEYTKDELLNNLFINKLKHNPVSYLFKRTLFIDNNLFFPENIDYGEDYAVIYRFFNLSKVGFILNERLYKYVQRNNSATHKPKLKYARDNLEVSRDILNYFENTAFYSGAKCYVIPRLITALSISCRMKSSKVITSEIENEINRLSKHNYDLAKYQSTGLKIKVYLNRFGLLKYVYRYKRK